MNKFIKKTMPAVVLLASFLVSSSPAMAREVHVGGETLYTYVDDNGVNNDLLELPVTMHVDGRFIASDVTPTIRSGRTLVPLRAAGEALDAEITWDQTTQSATAVKNGNVVRFTLNNPVYTVNGDIRYADVPTMLINNRTMLPLRALAEALNAQVEWDQELYDVTIDTSAPDLPSANIPAGTPATVVKLVEKFYVPSNEADPFVGNWFKTYSESWQSGSLTTHYDYIFVTPLNGGYHCISLSASSATTQSFVSIRTTRDTAGRCENPNTNLYSMAESNMYYFFGYGTDTSPNQNYYTASEENLLFNGWYNALENRFHTPSYDFQLVSYDRF